MVAHRRYVTLLWVIFSPHRQIYTTKYELFLFRHRSPTQEHSLSLESFKSQFSPRERYEASDRDVFSRRKLFFSFTSVKETYWLRCWKLTLNVSHTFKSLNVHIHIHLWSELVNCHPHVAFVAKKQSAEFGMKASLWGIIRWMKS